MRAVAAALTAAALAALPPSRTMLAKLRAALAAPVINDVATDVDDAPRFADGAPLPEVCGERRARQGVGWCL